MANGSSRVGVVFAIAIALAAHDAAAQSGFCTENYPDYYMAVESNEGAVVEGQQARFVLTRYDDEEGTTPQTDGDETEVFVLARLIVVPDEMNSDLDVQIREDSYKVLIPEDTASVIFRMNTEDESPNMGNTCRQPGAAVGSADGPCSAWGDTTVGTIAVIDVLESDFYDSALVDGGIVDDDYLPHYSCTVVTETMPVEDPYHGAWESYRDLVPVIDNDASGPPAVSLSISSDVALRGIDEGEELVVTLTRARSEGLMTVNVAVSETEDMIAAGLEGSRTVEFPAGESSVEFRLPTVDDEEREAASVVTVALEEGVGYMLGTATTINATVADNDTPVVGVVRRGPTVRDEGDEIQFVLERNPTGRILIVQVRVTETEDMLADEDEGLREIVFEVGESTARFSVPTQDDEERERDSVIAVTVVEGENYNVSQHGSAAVTVRDDEEGPLPPRGVKIRAQTARVVEGQDAVFVLTRPAPFEESLAVNVSVSETGTMIDSSPLDEEDEGGDDADQADQAPVPCITPECKVEFATSASTTRLIIRTVDDEFDEGDSVLTARILPGVGYTVDPLRTATVTVTDNDLGSRISIVLLIDDPGRQRIFIQNAGPTDAEFWTEGFYPETTVRVEEIGDGIRGHIPAGGSVSIPVWERIVIEGGNETAASLRVRASVSVTHAVSVIRGTPPEVTRLPIRPE